MMWTVALGRLGPVIMRVAKVIHALGHSAGLSLGGSLPQSCFAGADVVDSPVPERAGRSIRILNHHREAACLIRSVLPRQGRRDVLAIAGVFDRDPSLAGKGRTGQ